MAILQSRNLNAGNMNAARKETVSEHGGSGCQPLVAQRWRDIRPKRRAVQDRSFLLAPGEARTARRLEAAAAVSEATTATTSRISFLSLLKAASICA